MIDIGTIIKTRRKELELRQEDLHRLTGISRSMICKYETGKCRPKHDTLEILCKYLDLNIKDLVGEEETESVTLSEIMAFLSTKFDITITRK